MIQKSNKVIIFAVIAVIIVAAPLSFYEYDQLHVIHLPLVLSTNSTSSYTWSGNFSYQPYGCRELNMTEQNVSTEILSPGEPISYLNMTISGKSFYLPAFSGNTGANFAIIVNVSGLIAPKLKPDRIELVENFSVPPDMKFYSCFGWRDYHNTTKPGPLYSERSFNTSLCKPNPHNITAALVNESLAVNGYYSFAWVQETCQNILRTYPGDNIYIGFEYYLLGMSNPVTVSFLLRLQYVE